jgi:hypothetical protein
MIGDEADRDAEHVADATRSELLEVLDEIRTGPGLGRTSR